MLPDYYSILGVSKDASYLEIKAAYRSLAKEHHPDKHGGDKDKEQLFKIINEAYSVLSHTDSKLSYDKRREWEVAHPYPKYSPPTPPPPTYRPPQQPYQYAPRTSRYTSEKYVYSKWTLMYGKIFVVLLIMFVVLMPIMLEYSFSNYFYNKGLQALAQKDYFEAENNFVQAMRDLGGSNTAAAIKGAELKLHFNSNFEALSYVKAGLGFAETTPQRARLYYLYGLASKKLHRMEDSNDAFQAALRYGYNRDSVYLSLAPLYAYELKAYPEAIASYDSLIAYYPDEYDHYVHRGFCYQKINNHIRAINDFNTFMDKRGVDGSAMYLKAVSQVSLNEMDSACANFQQSLDLGIANASTFLKLYCDPDSAKIEYPSANPF